MCVNSKKANHSACTSLLPMPAQQHSCSFQTQRLRLWCSSHTPGMLHANGKLRMYHMSPALASIWSSSAGCIARKTGQDRKKRVRAWVKNSRTPSSLQGISIRDCASPLIPHLCLKSVRQQDHQESLVVQPIHLAHTVQRLVLKVLGGKIVSGRVPQAS